MKNIFISLIMAVMIAFSSVSFAQQLGDGIYAHHATYDVIEFNVDQPVMANQSFGLDYNHNSEYLKLADNQYGIIFAVYSFSANKYEIGWQMYKTLVS